MTQRGILQQPISERRPVLVRNRIEIDHNWGYGSPGAGVPADYLSVRWTREVDLESGSFFFRVRVDDGVRLWMDNSLVIDG